MERGGLPPGVFVRVATKGVTGLRVKRVKEERARPEVKSDDAGQRRKKGQERGSFFLSSSTVSERTGVTELRVKEEERGLGGNAVTSVWRCDDIPGGAWASIWCFRGRGDGRRPNLAKGCGGLKRHHPVGRG